MCYIKGKMKKIIFGSLLFILMLSIGFSFIGIPSVSAQISGGDDSNPAVVHLINKVKNGKDSYFNSFVQAGLTSSHYAFRDYKGNQVYNYIIRNMTTDSFSDKNAIVKSEVFSLSSDYQKIANAAKLYVSGSAGHLAASTDDRDKVIFSLITTGALNETKTITGNRVYTSGSYAPLWVETERTLLQSGSTIQFNFETQKGYGQDNSKGFYVFDPCLNYSVEIDSLTTLIEGRDVFRGEQIYLNATNPILELFGGETINYFKNIFKIEWEVTKGKAHIDKEALANGYLKVSNTATGDITVRAKCKSSSVSNEYIYSPTITFKVKSGKTGVSVASNFEEGIKSVSYSQNGTNYDVSVVLNDGFVPADTANYNSATKTLTFQNVAAKSVVNLALKKQISIKEIVAKNKAYDGTTAAEIKEIVFSEKVNKTIGINGLTISFNDTAAGTSSLSYEGTAVLASGLESEYELVASKTPIVVSGQILKRDVVVSAKYTTQGIGQTEKPIEFTATGLVNGESLGGKLAKESGTTVGKYRITIGTLASENPNYNIIFFSNVYEITKINFKITDVTIEKVYDGETEIQSISIDNLEFSIKNGTEYISATWIEIAKDSNVGLRLTASFKDNANVGAGKPVSFVAELIGTDKANFELESVPTNVYGKITKAPIEITAHSDQKQFGDSDPELTYTITSGQLYNSDSLTGELSRQSGENVGVYQIQKGTLSAGNNYQLTFVGNTFEVIKRQVKVNALKVTKHYGDVDEQLTYELVGGTTEVQEGLNLKLEREKGELVGIYEISVVSYNDRNYEIVSFTQEGFEILKREIIISVYSKEKEYDSTDRAEVVYEISNLQANNPDNIRIDITAKFRGTTVREWGILYYYEGSLITDFSSSLVLGNNVDCYDITFDVNYTANITIRKIYIVIKNGKVTKEWGDPDPNPLPYQIENGFEGIVLTGQLERGLTGQDQDGYVVNNNEVGIYPLHLGTLINPTNSQYFDISFKEETYYFEIIKRRVILSAPNTMKIYGEEDPEFPFALAPGITLPEGVSLQDILTNGKLSRRQGENVGKYTYGLGEVKLISTQQKNYELFLNENYLEIVPRDIEIQIENATKEYGEENPEFKYTIVSGSIGFEGDLIISYSGDPNVGKHELQALINSDNYNLTSNRAYLTITPAPIMIQSDYIQKTYGDEDPELTFYLSEGQLKYDDTFESILTGFIKRGEGENVGTYSILKNTLAANGNYALTFNGSNFVINKRDSYVVANPVEKFLDEISDPYELTYEVSNLIEGDVLSGELAVELTGVGEFEIGIGTLANSNYQIHYTSAIFKVSKRSIQIIVEGQTRAYDSTTNHGEFKYDIRGEIKEGHGKSYFNVVLSCNPEKNVGIYPIEVSYSSEVNTFYDVKIQKGCFEIKKRLINVEAHDVDIIYGDEIPAESDLQFELGEGSVIFNNEIEIKLGYDGVVSGAGEYDIIDKTIENDNYQINVKKGKLKITPKEIKVVISNFEKIYGNSDPEFTFSFAQGAVVQGDEISGRITREEGETVGVYELVCELENPNYVIKMDKTTLTINKRHLTIVVSIKDKVFDGTTSAEPAKEPEILNKVEGDDIGVEYNAAFADASVPPGRKTVRIRSSTLTGSAKDNYTYEFAPIEAQITYRTLTKEGVKISVEDGNTSLTWGSYIKVEYLLAEEIGSIAKDKNTESGIVILLYNGNNELITNFGKIKVTINLDEFPYEKFDIYLLNEDGKIEKMQYEEAINDISFETTKLGTFVATTDRNIALIYFLIALGSAVGAGAIITGIVVGVKKAKGKI